MDILTLEYLLFIALAGVLTAVIFALNSSCKKAEEFSGQLIEHVETLNQINAELEKENKRLKANLLYERTKDNADNI